MAEHLLESVADLPSFMKSALAELGETEKDSKKICFELSIEQKTLLDSMLAMSKSELQVDYESIVSSKQRITKRRLDVNSKMESLTKKALKVYDKMDATITDLDNKIGVLNGLLDAAVGARDTSRKDAKANAKQDEEALAESRARFQQSIEEYDPNEPVYCICRKISSGKMVGCSNDECLVEWFHYDCVGIPQDTPDEDLEGWLCPDCCKSQKR